MTARTLTQTLESETEPNQILRFMAVARNIPAWAAVILLMLVRS